MLASTLVVAVAGSLLHFAWAWSGRHPLVGVFAATSESTWEHLKLAFWPALFLALLQRRVYRGPPGWLPATAIRCLVPPALIVALFYGYTAVAGRNCLAADIGTFVVAVFVGELLGHAVMARRPSGATRSAAGAALALALVAFSTLTFRPPSWFLFEEPADRPHAGPRPETSRRPTPSVQAPMPRVPSSARGPIAPHARETA